MMWELIRANQRKSLWLFLAMGGILIILGYLIGTLYDSYTGGRLGILSSIVLWLVLALVSYYSGDKIILAIGNALEVTPDIHPQLFNIVEEMAIAANLKSVPRVFIIADPSLNAFATGRSPEKSAIAVTAGLLESLNRDELQGVVAHEISHIYNRDILFLTFAATMLGSIQLISETFLRGSFRGGKHRRYQSGKSTANGAATVITIIFALLGPLFARLLYLAISRKREYLADASAVRLTRYPEGLASALEKIAKRNLLHPFDVNKIITPFFIVNPLNTHSNDTHPPIFERIHILRKMAGYADFASYQQAFHNLKGKEQTIIPPVALSRKETIPIREAQPIEETLASNNQTTLHHVGDLIRAINNFAFISCSCGMKMKIPPEYNDPVLKCPRCGEAHPSPFIAINSQVRPRPTQDQTYTRRTTGWESFNCACGRLVQLSPLFCTPYVICPNCKSQIKIIS
jgi:heat shock protein HtpX